MSSSAVAKRYADALFGLASDRDVVGPVAEGLAKVREVLASDIETRRTLFASQVSVGDKKAVISSKLSDGLHPFVGNILCLLVDRRRESVLLELILNYFEALEASAGVLRIQVETATELGDVGESQLVAKLESATGKKVLIATDVDPDLIGGLRLTVGSTLIDGTIKRRFEDLGARLKKAV